MEAEIIIVRERLRLLAIGHYIYGGMRLFMLTMFVPFFVMMIVMTMAIPQEQSHKPSQVPAQHTADAANQLPATSASPTSATRNDVPPKIVIALFLTLFGGFIFAFVAIGGLTAYAGFCIQKRRRRTLIYIVSALNCLFMPTGTLLGVSTLLVLGSAEGKAEFADNVEAAASVIDER